MSRQLVYLAFASYLKSAIEEVRYKMYREAFTSNRVSHLLTSQQAFRYSHYNQRCKLT